MTTTTDAASLALVATWKVRLAFHQLVCSTGADVGADRRVKSPAPATVNQLVMWRAQLAVRRSWGGTETCSGYFPPTRKVIEPALNLSRPAIGEHDYRVGKCRCLIDACTALQTVEKASGG